MRERVEPTGIVTIVSPTYLTTVGPVRTREPSSLIVVYGIDFVPIIIPTSLERVVQADFTVTSDPSGSVISRLTATSPIIT